MLKYSTQQGGFTACAGKSHSISRLVTEMLYSKLIQTYTGKHTYTNIYMNTYIETERERERERGRERAGPVSASL